MFVPTLDRAALQQAITVLRHEIATASDPDQQHQLERDLRACLKQWLALAAPQRQPPPVCTRRYRRHQPSPDILAN